MELLSPFISEFRAPSACDPTRRETPALQLLDWLESSGSAQQPRHASYHTNGCKSDNNRKLEQCCGTGLFDGFRRIPSRGAKKGAIRFALSHGSE